MRPGSQLGCIQCGDSNFSQDILGFFSIFCSYNTYPYFQNFMDHTSRWQASFTDLGLGQSRTNSSLAQTPRPLCSILSSLSTSMGFLGYTYPSSDGPLSSAWALRPKPNCMIWAHDPTSSLQIFFLIIFIFLSSPKLYFILKIVCIVRV